MAPGSYRDRTFRAVCAPENRAYELSHIWRQFLSLRERNVDSITQRALLGARSTHHWNRSSTQANSRGSGKNTSQTDAC